MTFLLSGIRASLGSKFRTVAVMGTLWIATISAAAFLLYLGFDVRQRAYARLTDQVTSYVHLIAEHDRFGFTLADVILRDMLDLLTWNDFNGTMTPERRRAVTAHLMQHQKRLPGIVSFTLIGADGIRRIGVVGKDFTDLSRRGYFQALRDGKDFYISNIEDGLASKEPGIHVARRFNSEDGKFGGVIVMNLAAQNVFFSYYRSINLGENFTTSLRGEHRILINFPDNSVASRDIPTDSDPISKRIFAGETQGIVISMDPVDGLEKLTAFKRLEGTNIFATASLSTANAMNASIKTASASIASALALIMGAIGASFAISKTNLLAEKREMLAQANDELAKARDAAVKASTERQNLIRKLNTAVEDERKSIAIEIHDVLNAILIGVRLDSQRILSAISENRQPNIDEISERARSIVRHASDLYANCRAIVTRLRPEVLDMLGLEHAIEEMVRNYDAIHPSCRFFYEFSGDATVIAGDVSIAVYRLIQEALSNVVKHSRASHASVFLALRADKKELEIVIADDGIGFNPDSLSPGFGIIGMRERVDAMNGKLSFRTGENQGTEIRSLIPL